MLTTRAAVLWDDTRQPPYATSEPVTIEELHLHPPGPDEVLVQVAATGLCHSDLSVVDGNRPRPLPMVLGHEGAGIVIDVGPGVSDLNAGDHVVFSFVPSCGRCTHCQVGRPALCTPAAASNKAGTLPSGATPFALPNGTALRQHLGVSCLSEHTVVSTRSLVRVDHSLPLHHAALFGCAMQTGVGAVINTARLEVGASAAVFGLGGVGMAAVMGARAAGANPLIAVDPVPSKRDLALALGATHAFDAGPETVHHIRELTDGGTSFAFEAVGSAAVMAQAYAATAPGGATVAVGLPHPSQQLQVPAASLVVEEKRILGSYMGSGVPRRDVPRLVDLHLAGHLPVDRLISGTVSLDHINSSLDALQSGGVLRQIVTPTGGADTPVTAL